MEKKFAPFSESSPYKRVLWKFNIVKFSMSFSFLVYNPDIDGIETDW